MYKTLDPSVRVVILKALCDIRVEVLSLAAKILLDSWSFYYCLVSHFTVQTGNTCQLQH